MGRSRWSIFIKKIFLPYLNHISTYAHFWFVCRVVWSVVDEYCESFSFGCEWMSAYMSFVPFWRYISLFLEKFPVPIVNWWFIILPHLTQLYHIFWDYGAWICISSEVIPNRKVLLLIYNVHIHIHMCW